MWGINKVEGSLLVSPIDLYMQSTTFPAIVAVVILMRVVHAWRQRVPKRTCAPCPEFEVDPGVVARVRAYCALSMVERYGAHGPP
jgi:hypothetical protein